MNIFTQTPDWLQSVLTWILTGSNLVSVAGIIVSLFRLGVARSESIAMTNTQIQLLNAMVGKLSDTKNLADSVQAVATQTTNALIHVEKMMHEQRQSNANLAAYIVECFNRSNLSIENKTELKLLADKIFYNNNEDVIEALKQAKIEADIIAKASEENARKLESELIETRKKLELAQENTKANRRL